MYLVEVYVPRSHAREARASGRENVSIRYLRTTFLPDDETCFHLFEASSAEDVEEAGRRAELSHTRVVPAIDATRSRDDGPTESENGESRT